MDDSQACLIVGAEEVDELLPACSTGCIIVNVCDANVPAMAALPQLSSSQVGSPRKITLQTAPWLPGPQPRSVERLCSVAARTG
jgi:hypothetical protein